MEVTIVIFFLVAMAATSQTMSTSTPNPILLLRPYSGAGGHRIPGIDCLSWRLAVETNNLRQWKLVPEACEDYVGHYMLGKQYRDDCDKMAEIALEYAESVELVGDGKDVWVFDIDETSLSDLPYYARSDVAFGAIAYNDTKFDEWLAEGIAPAIPAVHKLYEKLLSLGFKIIFLSGSAERIKDIRISNLKGSGYHTWEKLILKKDSEKGTTALVYKSNKRKELEEEEGYRIWGNVGDQWSDLLGNNVGNRTFKVPNPMFYIG